MTLSAVGRATVHVAGRMEAAVFRGEDRAFELVAVPELELQPGEALAQVELATICGSDVHTWRGTRSAPTPLVLGHEQVGRIVALGDKRVRTVDGHDLQVGDRVVWGVAIDCGRCRYCRAGLPQKCTTLVKYGHERMRRGWELSGGLATHVHLRARTPIVRVGEKLPAAVLAPASCSTATVMAALDAASGIRPLLGATVLVSGCGMLGLTAVAAARSLGATVVATDPDPERRAAARSLGAVAVADGSPDGLRRALGQVRAVAGYGIALELSGAPSAVRTLLATADIGAVLVLVGSVFPAGTVPIDPETVVRRMLTVRGVHNYAPGHLALAVRFLETQDPDALAALVGPVYPLDAIGHAMLDAASGTSARVAVAPAPSAVTVR